MVLLIVSAEDMIISAICLNVIGWTYFFPILIWVGGLVPYRFCFIVLFKVAIYHCLGIVILQKKPLDLNKSLSLINHKITFGVLGLFRR